MNTISQGSINTYNNIISVYILFIIQLKGRWTDNRYVFVYCVEKKKHSTYLNCFMCKHGDYWPIVKFKVEYTIWLIKLIITSSLNDRRHLKCLIFN